MEKQAVSGWKTFEDVAAEGKQYALRTLEVGADDAYALARAAFFFSNILKDCGTGDVIAEQALSVNPNLSEAWRTRGWISMYLGRHEPAIAQFNYAIRLNPLDPQIYIAECGLAFANFFLRRFEIALSWATKSLARQKGYPPALRSAMLCYAMLGRLADAQMMLARMRETGDDLTISRAKVRMPYQHREDFDLWLEAFRLAGLPE
jgi:tetratricopeptide (TPR) repeat protein